MRKECSSDVSSRFFWGERCETAQKTAARETTWLCISLYLKLASVTVNILCLYGSSILGLNPCFSLTKVLLTYTLVCNSLLSSLPQHLLQKLQHVQNAMARLLTYTKKHDHISLILKEPHWLLVKFRIEFKILILTFKAYPEIEPKYLTDSLIKYTPSRSLRSTNKELSVVVPKYNIETYGKHAFSVIAPTLWNNLSLDIRTTACLSSFKPE